MGRFLGSDSNSSQPTLFQRHHGDNSSFFSSFKVFFVQLFLAANFVFDSEAQQLGFFPRKSVFCCFTLDCSWPSSAGLWPSPGDPSGSDLRISWTCSWWRPNLCTCNGNGSYDCWEELEAGHANWIQPFFRPVWSHVFCSSVCQPYHNISQGPYFCSCLWQQRSEVWISSTARSTRSWLSIVIQKKARWKGLIIPAPIQRMTYKPENTSQLSSPVWTNSIRPCSSVRVLCI